MLGHHLDAIAPMARAGRRRVPRTGQRSSGWRCPPDWPNDVMAIELTWADIEHQARVGSRVQWTDPQRNNVTNRLTRSLAGGTGLPRLDTSRLRATWLAETAALIGLPAFLHSAGPAYCQRERNAALAWRP